MDCQESGPANGAAGSCRILQDLEHILGHCTVVSHGSDTLYIFHFHQFLRAIFQFFASFSICFPSFIRKVGHGPTKPKLYSPRVPMHCNGGLCLPFARGLQLIPRTLFGLDIRCRSLLCGDACGDCSAFQCLVPPPEKAEKTFRNFDKRE